MKTSLLFLSCAATLAMASCSQEKTTDTTAANDGAVTTTTTTTTTSPALYTDEAYQRRADRIAADVAAKMKLDDATRTKVRTVYYNRAKSLGELHQKYATDTTGMAAAMRSVYNDADTQLKTVFVDPAQYTAYESSRSAYDETNYMDDNAMASDSTSSMSSSSDNMSNSDNSSMAAGTSDANGSAMNASKMKAKADDGSKIKVKENGKVKTKDAMGDKSKTQ